MQILFDQADRVLLRRCRLLLIGDSPPVLHNACVIGQPRFSERLCPTLALDIRLGHIRNCDAVQCTTVDVTDPTFARYLATSLAGLVPGTLYTSNITSIAPAQARQHVFQESRADCKDHDAASRLDARTPGEYSHGAVLTLLDFPNRNRTE
jgi:hypothetical protein